MARLMADSLVLEDIVVSGYERVIYVKDAISGLKAIICIHNTALGPALGGTRIYPYPNFEAGLTDVMRLAKGMTYKSALAGAGLGGGKSVFLCHSKQKTPEMLRAFAEALNRLEGLYTAAEDLGTSVADVTYMSEYTPYIVGVQRENSSGNPSPFTAWGVFRGIQAALKKTFGNESVAGRKIAIQGLGSVGQVLAELLFWHGASLIVSDIDWEKTLQVAKRFGATACPAEDIMSCACDVFAPCALGGIINASTIPNLRCRIVAGCANNQLLREEDGEALFKRAILYVPDFVINAGGLINVTEEISVEGYHSVIARNKVDGLYDQLLQIFEIAEQKGSSTHQAAVALGDYRIKYGIGKRTVAPKYHHFQKQL